MRALPRILLAIAVTASPAVAADRLTDRDVKELVARIEQGRDRFDNALDGKLKDSIVRGASGEVRVDKFLDDFQENIDRLEERLKPEYAASAEAATLLRQATLIERFFKQQPPGTKGESEWNRLTTDLKALAAAYGAEFPLADNASVRRLGDREVAVNAEQIADAADQLKDSLDAELKKDPSIDKATRQGIVHDVDQLSKDAKTLRGRVKDSKPSSAEADQLLARAARIRTFIESHNTPAAAGAWAGLNGRLQTLASAYGKGSR
ncbi:MAG TPA: hypothetical protein VFJ02_03775 [Vicinamibacterales bacterium]|nr:hypothetical protein [Vicinamibacterales bacterium]